MTNKLETGNLTPGTNTTVVHRRYIADSFAQPDGFAGVLTIRVNENGRLEVFICQKNSQGEINQISIGLTNEQRLDLAKCLGRHKPVKWENVSIPYASKIVER